jgi:hypothetical protein
MEKKIAEDYKEEAGAESATSPETAVLAPTTSEAPAVEPTPVDPLDTRVAAFNEALQPLLETYQLKLLAEPFIADGKTLARPVVVDAAQAVAPKVVTEILTP